MDFENVLIGLADAYEKATGIKPATAATEFANYGGFFERLKKGGGVTGRTYRRALQWFSDHWPEDTDTHPWPAGIDRPERSKKEAA